MSNRARCPWCGSAKSWRLSSGRRRCARCRRDFSRPRLPLRLDRAEWRAVLTWYARGLPSQAIADATGLDRKRVLRALMIVRQSLAAALARIAPLPRRFDNGGVPPVEDRRTLAIGIRFRLGHPSAEIIPGVDGRLVARELRRRVPHLGDLERAIAPYAAIVAGGRLRHVTAEDPHPPHGYAELGAFWQYLSQELSNRGGIRAERLMLYLAEYSWRYRWRRWSLARRVAALEKLIDPAVEVAPTELWGTVEPRAAGGVNLTANV